MNPLFSIVIPTKDRYQYLIPLIDKLMRWHSNDFEVVIQDNSQDNLQGISIKKKYLNDNRLKYFHVKEHLNVVENSILAIDNSLGKYICYIGDDDGIIEHAVDIVKWMDKNGIDSLNCNHGAFCWGDFRIKNRSKKASLAGMLLYKKSTGSFRFMDPQKLLLDLLQNGALVMNGITKVYHGIIRRDLLDKVKNVTGSYFPGPVPDMTNAVSLSFYSTKHVFLDYPLIIAGAGGGSMAGKGGQRTSHGEIKDQPFLPSNTYAEWSKELPKYWCPQTIWPEGAIQALKKNKHLELIKFLNFPKIFAEMMIWVPSKRQFVLDFINQNYPSNEAKSIIKKIPYYKQKYKIGRMKYEIKVLSVITGTYGLLGLTKIDADSIDVALTKLENITNNRIKLKDCELSKII